MTRTMYVRVDGNDLEVEAGSILHALAHAGVRVPSLCDDARLEPYGE